MSVTAFHLKGRLAALLAVSVFLLSLAAGLTLSTTSAEAARKPTVIVFVDSDRLFIKSKVGENVRAQVKVFAEEIQAGRVKAEETINSQKLALRQKRDDGMSDSDFAAQAQDIAQLERTLKIELQLQTKALELGEARALAEVQKVLNPILANTLLKHKADVMLDTTMIIVGGVDIDVTAEVMAELNKQITSVKVTPFTPEEMQRTLQ